MPPSLWLVTFLDKSKLVARKQGHGAQKASAGKEFSAEILLCFRRKRRAHRAPGREPLQGNDYVPEERTACPPCTMLGTGPARPRNSSVPHGFCAPCPCFRAWQRRKFNSPDAYLAKSEGSKFSWVKRENKHEIPSPKSQTKNVCFGHWYLEPVIYLGSGIGCWECNG